jgi:hypothetical protein
MFKNMINNLGGTNDVNVISYGKENIGGEKRETNLRNAWK